MKTIKKLICHALDIFGYGVYKDDKTSFTNFVKQKTNGKKDLVGVEVGVWRGENALRILKKLNIKKLYLIDPYFYDEEDGSSCSSDLKEAEKQAKIALSKWEHKIEFIKATSMEALKLIPDKLDFVYIDANHNYHKAKEDMEEWYNKIPKKSILAGHDINNIQYQLNGVTESFIDFVKEKNLKPYIGGNNWIIVKGEHKKN